MAKISVIVPCFNVSDCVHRCIEALVRQTIGIENLEIILVDDASTDDGRTMQELLKYEGLYPDNIMVIPLAENLRQGGARNVGISYASGDYILFCDADDWIHDVTIEHLYNTAVATDSDIVEYGANVISSYEEFPELSREEDGDSYIDITTDDIRKIYLMSKESSYGCMYKFYRASLIKDNNIRFPEHVFLEEPGFIFLTRLYEKRHFFLREKLHYNYLRPESTMRGSFANKRFDNMNTYIHFINDVKNRDIYLKYKTEIDYFFWKGCFYKTLALAASTDFFFDTEEFIMIQHNTIKEISSIKDNPYYQHDFSKCPEFVSLTYCDATKLDMNQIKELVRTL